MKVLFIVVMFALSLHAEDLESYLTVGMVSHHFGSNEAGDTYNEDHKAIGAEFVLKQRYTLAYLHFDNSRDKTTDILALGYRYPVWGPFGIYVVAGYQQGYCFEGLKSVECTEGKDNNGFAAIPMLYYRHEYFTLDLISQGTMVGLKLNLKIF